MGYDWQWHTYYDNLVDPPIRETLRQALEWRGERPPGFAIDLGCGIGNDAIRLLDAGWSVLAIDNHPEGLKRLVERSGGSNRLETRLASFEEVSLPPADLVTASYALPFCPPSAFHGVWEKVKKALKPGGVFAGHFFGPEDAWAERGITVLTAPEIQDLLAGMKILHFSEIRKNGPQADGKMKDWHIFEATAARPG